MKEILPPNNMTDEELEILARSEPVDLDSLTQEELVGIRRKFRAELAGMLLSQELGVKTLGITLDPESCEKLAKAYEEHPEKLFNDIKVAGKETDIIREIAFQSRERIPAKELTDELKEEIRKDYRKAYRYQSLGVERKDELIKKSAQMMSQYKQKEIQAAQDKAEYRLQDEITNIESMRENELIVSKALITGIAKAREALGREADPAKFCNGYKDLQNEGREVLILINSARIRDENMTHEQILNTYANGEEKDDIMSKVKENVKEAAKARAEKNINNRAATRSHEKAEERAKEKGVWKEKEIEKAKPKTRTRTKTKDKGREMGE